MTTPESCRHEYVKIYQRKLKGLDRRLVATRAYLPVGFKMADFGHLSEGSYCFCTKCRARLFPKRTNADRAQARLVAAAGKLAEMQADHAEEIVDDALEKATVAIAVEELEIDAVALDDLDEGGVGLPVEDEESL